MNIVMTLFFWYSYLVDVMFDAPLKSRANVLEYLECHQREMEHVPCLVEFTPYEHRELMRGNIETEVTSSSDSVPVADAA